MKGYYRLGDHFTVSKGSHWIEMLWVRTELGLAILENGEDIIKVSVERIGRLGASDVLNYSYFIPELLPREDVEDFVDMSICEKESLL